MFLSRVMLGRVHFFSNCAPHQVSSSQQVLQVNAPEDFRPWTLPRFLPHLSFSSPIINYIVSLSSPKASHRNKYKDFPSPTEINNRRSAKLWNFPSSLTRFYGHQKKLLARRGIHTCEHAWGDGNTSVLPEDVNRKIVKLDYKLHFFKFAGNSTNQKYQVV